MKCGKLTSISEALAFCVALLTGCAQPEVTGTAPPARSQVEDDDDAGIEEEEDEETDDSERGRADAGRADAGDAGDSNQEEDEQQPEDEDEEPRDAGTEPDAGDRVALACLNYVDRGNLDVDLLDCEQFMSSECDSYAAETCQGLHFFMDRQVFRAFVECVADTPGLDFCDEDPSVIVDCEAEAKAKACTTHQPACEAYEGCETMSVDECDRAVAVFSTQTIEMFGDIYDCDTSPTYFF